VDAEREQVSIPAWLSVELALAKLTKRLFRCSTFHFTRVPACSATWFGFQLVLIDIYVNNLPLLHIY